jgi:sulfur carrier protein
MNIKVNGAPQFFLDVLSIAELLKQNKVDKPEMVSVQLNGEFVDRNDFATTLINEHDEIDFLYFMGGGQGGKYQEV